MVDFKGGRSAEWILRWPQMSVLSVSALFWTRAVEEAIEGRQLSRLVQQCQEDVIELVRGVRGELNELARLSLSTLLVQDVHARDVAEHLLEEGVESLTDFEWRCQLRTYYEAAASASRWGALGHKKLSEMRFEPRTPLASARARNDSLGLDIPAGTPKKTPIQRRPSALTRSASRHMRDVSASSQPSHGAESEFVQDGMALCLRMMDARVEYGYEYQGNSTRLVITPLTDRCYRTLTMSYQLHLGGAPEGPAGTGKTETTKDLAKAVARHW